MKTFGQVLEWADALSLEEQESLVEDLRMTLELLAEEQKIFLPSSMVRG